ncbi:HIRAN domain-containing protein [Gordonia rhizosphera]|uniref:Uncharacterized protein n=1 Tax=Gordonia rhizosphera NBRC 16068 TaxID=1108045 RepID=K6WJ19_9ACTN|nr:HIRAN domain-containing protein [Gordonia rhizosphera]GAB93776.1 hypothetical protein GORHZ_245_00140 [Gordonia rhizosphera NBRC 16068]
MNTWDTPTTSFEGHGARFDVDRTSIAKVNGTLTAAAFGTGIRVPLESVVGVQYRAATRLVNGHLQVVVAGASPTKPVAGDPFTVVFTRKKQPAFEQLRDWLVHVAEINRSRPDVIVPDTNAAAAPVPNNAETITPRGSSLRPDFPSNSPNVPQSPADQRLSNARTGLQVERGRRVADAGAPQVSKPREAARLSVKDMEVAGESYQPKSFARLFHHAGKPLGGQIWREAELVAEPKNPHDRHAVAVYVEEHKVGYVPAERASAVQAQVLRAKKARQRAVVDARIWATNDHDEWSARVTLDPTEEREPDWAYVDRPRWPGRQSPDGSERLTDVGLLRQMEEADAAKLINGRDFETYRPDVAQARADGDTERALALLDACITAAEHYAAVWFSCPVSWPTEQTAIIYRSLKNYEGEVVVLERYFRADPSHAGTKSLRTRLARARELAGLRGPSPAVAVNAEREPGNDPKQTVLVDPLPTREVVLPEAAELAREKDYMDVIIAILNKAQVPRGQAYYTKAVVRELDHHPRGRGRVAVYVDQRLVGVVGAFESDIVRDVIRRDDHPGHDVEIRCRVYLSDGSTPHARITLGPYERVVAREDETEGAARARQDAEDQAQLRRERLAAGGREAEDQRRRLVRGQDLVEWVEPINELKRANRYEDALSLLHECIDAAEQDARFHGDSPAPWFTEQAAILHRKAGDIAAEIAVLERYQRACPVGGRSTSIDERLVKAKARSRYNS